MDIQKELSEFLSVGLWQVQSTVQLIREGATIPFIARYRKEMTGGLDDGQLRELQVRLTYLENLEKRKSEVAASITEQGKMTEELAALIESAATLARVEDLYRPYKQKRKTRASVARERGLEPLALILMEQKTDMQPPLTAAENFVNDDVPSPEEALAGAMDIIAEDLSDSAVIRGKLREHFLKDGLLRSRGSSEEENVYSGYYDYGELCAKSPPYRILAVNRGEKEGFLKVAVEADLDYCKNVLFENSLKGDSPAKKYISAAAEDSLSRLIYPSLESEVRGILTERAEASAIKIFAENLRQLLMQPPLRGRVVLGLDPAYRTGCKIAVVDDTGKVLDVTVIYPTPPQSKVEQAKQTIKALVVKHHVNVISIGNGTASKESEMFVAELISELPEHKLSYMVVSEAGASVYSASKLAAEEFPEFDVSLRSAVSIARRLQDPLAELVKIDPKAIGVGQYQHDMSPKNLDQSLGGVVEACVNSVGVDLNTASHSLLAYVAGVNASVAAKIVKYREENGRFDERKQLLKVEKLGKKAFEQSAGFLRIKDGKNILDNTAVHPESYKSAQLILEKCGFSLADVENANLDGLGIAAQTIGIAQIAAETQVGEPTVRDIIDELMKPGRDPRSSLPQPLLRTDILSAEDLQPDMILDGTVRNIVDFGAFVDIGVHQDGLVHISQLSDKFIRHPLDAVKLGDVVKVRVLSVDLAKKRIALSMKG